MKRNISKDPQAGSINMFSYTEWKETMKQPNGPHKKQTWSSCLRSYSLVIFSGILLFIFYYISLTYLYKETYVYQSTILADYIRPINRTICLPKDVRTPISHRRLKIAMFYMYDNKDGSWDPDIMDLIVKNRKKYCDAQGYTLVDGNKYIDTSRPAAWSKILIASHLISLKGEEEFDYIFYIDMDVVIMNMNMRIESFLEASRDINTQITDQDFIMTGDWNGPNTGVWIAKVSPFTEWFFKTAWNVGIDFANSEKSSQGIAYPFEYEQRVFHYLLNTQIWQERKLPSYNEVSKEEAKKYTSEQIRSHFAFLPQCSFNSYSIHPFFWKGNKNKEVSQYIHGDFLIHFAGKKGDVKKNIIKYYLEVSEEFNVPVKAPTY